MKDQALLIEALSGLEMHINVDTNMTIADIIYYRLINQQIAKTKFTQPQEIVSWLVAMQAQDFAMAKWAIGLRLFPGRKGLPLVNDAAIEKAFNEGTILRTHMMRPTWHFVSPADIRWMLALTAPRVNAISAYYYRKSELNSTVFKRASRVLTKALEGGNQLTRATLKSALERAKIVADGLRLSYIMMRAELDGIICSGARQGKQFTYALLEERVPPSKKLSRDEALAELTKRYFTSRGPATLQDFVWWSGLTMKDAVAGVAMLKPQLVRKSVNGQEYLFTQATLENDLGVLRKNKLEGTFLMPDYDEYGISYKDRSAIFDKNIYLESRQENNGYTHMIVVNGVIAGTWQRKIKNSTIVVETTSFASLTKANSRAIADAVKRYNSFVSGISG